MDLIDLIRQHVVDRGYPPSIRELSAVTGLSVGAVHARLVKLEEEGRLVREGARAMRIIEKENHDDSTT